MSIDEVGPPIAMEYLDLPPVAGRRSLRLMLRASTTLFEALFGPSRSLKEDLETSSKFFNPVAQGQRLRRELSKVPAVQFDPSSVPQSWLFRLPEQRVLISPEGIAGMHAVKGALASTDAEAVFLSDSVHQSVLVLLEQYRDWSRHRISGVVRLLEGDEKPLQIQAIGTLLALLVNQNVGPNAGVGRYDERDPDKRDAVDRAFFEPVLAFTKVLAPDSKVKSGGSKLISGWTMYEIARRFGPGFHVQPSEGGAKGTVYIGADRIEHALQLIARDLNRGHRRRTNPLELALAFDQLVEVFRQNRGTLAGFGELHESADQTEALRERLLEEYQRQSRNVTTGDPVGPN